MEVIMFALLILLAIGCFTFEQMFLEFVRIDDMVVIKGTCIVLFILFLHASKNQIQIMSYWDINQFLAEEEKIQFSINQDSHFIDFLDTTKDGVILAGQTTTTHIWLLNTLFDYLQIPQGEVKPHMPEDFHIKSLDRINSFKVSHRNTVEQVRTKTEMPYFYEIYESLKKVTAVEDKKVSPDKMSQFLEDRGKLIINRASGIFEQSNTDPMTNNYTKFQMDIYKLTRLKALEYHNWKKD